MLIRLPTVAVAGMLALCSYTALAQSTPASKPDPLLAQVRAAIDDAGRGQADTAQYARLVDHPLYGWIEYASLRRDIDTLPDTRGQSFLTRYKGQPVAEAFRATWLASLARRQEWPAFLAAWSPSITSTSLHCAQLDARQATGKVDAQWIREMQAIWGSTGKSLPEDCDRPIVVLAAHGGLPPKLRWERIDKAAGEWNAGVMRTAATGLPVDQRALAEQYAGFMRAVTEQALTWPKTDRSRWVASQGLARLGKRQPDAAEAQLPEYANALDFTEADKGRVLYQVALWTVASYDPGSERRLAAVPAASYDERLHAWQVREALSRSDWPVALAAIRAMPDEQRTDARWTYFEARLLELTGDKAAANAAYQRAARIPEFHGFLAADRLDQPYALCPWLPNDSAAAKAAVARDPSLVRAIDLYQIGRKGWAIREWKDALTRFDDTQRRIAVDIAQDHGWYDRGVFGLGRTPDERRLYALRFPLHHDQTIRREAASNGLDPAWVAAEIRAESIFDIRARSPANARGLMQVLPGTGATVSRQLGLAWGGTDSLYDADTNIVLGTAYLRQLLDKYGGRPYWAIAGYNAGPRPLQRWQSERPTMDPDFWIETISYKETREYVARVLAFSTIYDWRLNGDAVRLTDRMWGRSADKRKQFACPLAKAKPVAGTSSRKPPGK